MKRQRKGTGGGRAEKITPRELAALYVSLAPQRDALRLFEAMLAERIAGDAGVRAAVQAKVDLWWGEGQPEGPLVYVGAGTDGMTAVDRARLEELYEKFQRRRAEDKGEWPEYTGPGR